VRIRETNNARAKHDIVGVEDSAIDSVNDCANVM
jgi:hypothetical protein